MDDEPFFVVEKEYDWDEFVRIFYRQEFVACFGQKWWGCSYHSPTLWNVRYICFGNGRKDSVVDLDKCDQIRIFNGLETWLTIKKEYNPTVKYGMGMFLIQKQKFKEIDTGEEDDDGYPIYDYKPTNETYPYGIRFLVWGMQ